MSAVSSWHHRPGDPERHASPGAAAESHGHQQAAVTGQSDDVTAISSLLIGWSDQTQPAVNTWWIHLYVLSWLCLIAD